VNEITYCRTCKHALPECKDVHCPIGYYECTSEKIRESGYPTETTEDSLVYSYDEGGAFYVGARFGCVHHEEKTAK
jgi:hypothetical protein